MTDERRCSKCGSKLSTATVLGGVCPRCLLELGTQAEADSSDAPTLVDDTTTTLGHAAASTGTSERARSHPERITMVQGSSSRPRSQTADLLQRRMKVAAQLISLAIGLFFVRDLVLGKQPQDLGWRVAMLVIFVAMSVYLRRRTLSMGQARATEIVGLGLLVAWFAYNEHFHLVDWAQQQNHSAVLFTFSSEVLAFYVVMSGYAMFIPNTWRRALLIVGGMAVVPFVTLGAVRVTNPVEYRLVAASIDLNSWSFLAVVMVVGVLVASAGANVIHTLRRQVADARRLGQYRLKEKIGEGGMGEVWKADHRFLVRPAAIKLIKPGIVAGGDPQLAESMLRSFEREVQATAMLRSVHTIEVYDFGVTEDETFYYVMELLDGFDLQTLVKRFGPLPPERVVHIMLQVCESLAEAHAAGLTHRDLKPANIFTCRMGTAYDFVKVLDFGLVKMHHEDGVEEATLTGGGAIVGTPAFMSPEAVLGRDQDARSDIYALACVGFWLLTGHLVFEADTPLEMAVQQAQVPATLMSTRFPDIAVPKQLEDVLLSCLEKDPSDRPASAAELARSLSASGIGESWTPAAARRWWDSV